MESMTVAHPAIPLAACYLLLIGQLTGSPVSSTALALLVVRRHLANRSRTQFCGQKPTKPREIGCHGNDPWGIEKL